MYIVEHSKRESTVRVYKQVGIFTQELNKIETDCITKIVEQQNLGFRTAWDQWKMRDHHSITMFVMKFHQLENL